MKAHTVSFRLSDEAYNKLNENVNNSGLNKSQFLSDLIMSNEIAPMSAKDETIVAMCRLQIIAAKYGYVENEELTKGLNDLWQSLR